MFLDGSGFKEAVATLGGREPQSPARHPGPAPADSARPARLDRSDDVNRKRAGDIWRASADPRGTLVHVYLENRKLDLPNECAGEVIRYHPACPMDGERFPAMVCLVRNIRTDEPQAIHRTALTANGTALKRGGKTCRLSLGPVSGGAIKIDPDEDVTQGLCIGEGVETSWQAGKWDCTRSGIFWARRALRASWSCLESKACTFLRESDANLAGPKASNECFVRWRDAGREVIFADPGLGSDLADEVAA